MTIKKISSFFFFLFLVVGCATNNSNSVQVSKPKSIPSWYLNPPKSTQNFVYATGSGISKKEAVLKALSNFVSTYSVTVSSSFKSRSQDFGGGLYSKNSVNDIKATVKQFEVSNYSIEKVEQYSFDKVFVLIKVDINQLYLNTRNKLDDRFREYQKEYSLISRENLLKQYIDLRNLNSKIQKEKNYIYILKTMNTKFNEKKYLNFINQVKYRLNSVKNNLHIKVVSNNFAIGEDIKKYLVNKGIKIGRSDIKLYSKVVKNKSHSYMKLVVYKVYINLKYRHNTIGNNFFKIVAPPTANINGYLYDDIKNLSLEKFLNLR